MNLATISIDNATLHLRGGRWITSNANGVLTAARLNDDLDAHPLPLYLPAPIEAVVERAKVIFPDLHIVHSEPEMFEGDDPEDTVY